MNRACRARLDALIGWYVIGKMCRYLFTLTKAKSATEHITYIL